MTTNCHISGFDLIELLDTTGIYELKRFNTHQKLLGCECQTQTWNLLLVTCKKQSPSDVINHYALEEIKNTPSQRWDVVPIDICEDVVAIYTVLNISSLFTKVWTGIEHTTIVLHKIGNKWPHKFSLYRGIYSN